MNLAAALAVTVMISGCAASITSRPFDKEKAGDGIVYKLPVREYSVAVTYELVSCPADPSAPAPEAKSDKPAEDRALEGLSKKSEESTAKRAQITNPGKSKTKEGLAERPEDPCELANSPSSDSRTSEPSADTVPEAEAVATKALQVNVVDVVVSSELVPSKDVNDWFEIDPKALNEVFSSVDPATIELSSGMISTVGIKTTGATAQVIPLAAQLAGLFGLQFEGEPPQCTKAARDSLAKLLTLKADHTKRQDCLAWAEKEMLRTPAKDAERRVKLARERLAQAAERYSKIRDTALRKKVTYRLSPPATNTQSPTPEELADWVEFPNGAEPTLTPALSKAFHVQLKTESISTTGTGIDRKLVTNPFPGVYYRRPATATVIISVASGDDKKVYRVLDISQAIPQLGTLQRVAMKGSAFGSRNISVAFDETGQLKKYELTSKGMAEAMTASVKEVDAAFAKPEKPSELEKLTDEVNLLTKKRELIDAKAALEAAESGSDQP